jgi:hypothetical protein
VHADENDVPPELLRLSRFERPTGTKRFGYWHDHLNEKHPEASADNRQKALNLAYIGVAQMWLAWAVPFGLIGAGLWSLHDSDIEVIIAAACSGFVIVAMALLAVRWRQAHSFWAAKVYPGA